MAKRKAKSKTPRPKVDEEKPIPKAKKKPAKADEKSPSEQELAALMAGDVELLTVLHCCQAITESDVKRFTDLTLHGNQAKDERGAREQLRAVMRFASLGWQTYFMHERGNAFRDVIDRR